MLIYALYFDDFVVIYKYEAILRPTGFWCCCRSAGSSTVAAVSVSIISVLLSTVGHVK